MKEEHFFVEAWDEFLFSEHYGTLRNFHPVCCKRIEFGHGFRRAKLAKVPNYCFKVCIARRDHCD